MYDFSLIENPSGTEIIAHRGLAKQLVPCVDAPDDVTVGSIVSA